MTVDANLVIRKAVVADAAQILAYIRELADYENLLHEVVTDRNILEQTLFGEQPSARVFMAEWESSPAGFALYHEMYSTFYGQPGLYLEDLYVKPQFRGHGIGKALLMRLARLAGEENYCRLDWSCLKWNSPAIDFYLGIGAFELDDWTRFRLEGAALAKLAL
jgi:GNAT superfamily N-acetyltransferase